VHDRPLPREQHFAHLPTKEQLAQCHGSFRDAVQYTLDDGRVIHDDVDAPRPAERLLASSLLASTLVIVSSWLQLGIDDAANRLRASVVGR
jgi:hypothetical protein